MYRFRLDRAVYAQMNITEDQTRRLMDIEGEQDDANKKFYSTKYQLWSLYDENRKNTQRVGWSSFRKS